MQSALEMIKAASPIDTGNLRHNAIRLENKGEDKWEIYVNEEIAPYMPYTNEPWDIKIIEQGNFKKGQKRTVIRTWENPNEGWWDDVCERVAVFIAQQLGGTLE